MVRSKYEEALLAEIYPTPCTYCGHAWTCGQDVRDRKAVLHHGHLLCAPCVLPSDSVLTEWIMANSEDLSEADRAFAVSVAGLRDDELEINDSNRIIGMMEKANG